MQNWNKVFEHVDKKNIERDIHKEGMSREEKQIYDKLDKKKPISHLKLKINR